MEMLLDISDITIIEAKDERFECSQNEIALLAMKLAVAERHARATPCCSPRTFQTWCLWSASSAYPRTASHWRGSENINKATILNSWDRRVSAAARVSVSERKWEKQ